MRQSKKTPWCLFEPTHNTVKGSLALLKPKPIQPADAARVLKFVEVSTERGSSEAEEAVARQQIAKLGE